MGPSVSFHSFIMELLHHLNIAFGQLMPNSWRISISCMEIWMIFNERDMIKLDEFVHLYWLKDSKEFRSYELVPWDRKTRLIVDLPLSFQYWKSRYFFVSSDNWETPSNDLWGEMGDAKTRCVIFCKCLFLRSLLSSLLWYIFPFFFQLRSVKN